MRELTIREQMDLNGGTHYWRVTDWISGNYWDCTNSDGANLIYLRLLSQGKDVTITEVDY